MLSEENIEGMGPRGGAVLRIYTWVSLLDIRDTTLFIIIIKERQSLETLKLYLHRKTS